MTICTEDPKEWTMCLFKYDGPDPCSPSNSPPEAFCFKDVKVVNEIITGKVYDRDDNEADLSGTCSPFDHRSNVSRMSFFFKGANNKGVPFDILLTGWGYEPTDRNPIFVGGFVVLKPLSADPATSAVLVKFDAGDTGTGTGMQAACDLQIPK